MKIFFIASIHGKEKYGDNYSTIVKFLNKTGHTVFSDHVLKISKKEINEWENEKKVSFHKKIMDKIKTVDVVVAEISYSSMSVGYLISLALDCGKPTIVLYSGKKEPHILSTIEKSDRLFLYKYNNLLDLENNLKGLIEDASDQMDVRFNFFISPKIGAYLDWISKNKRIPRAVFLRRLIKEHMKKNKKYKD